jgi:Icc-related predicted phosphoesterase
MKCLVVSDLHYALKQFDWLTEVAPKFDMVIVAGDHLDVSGHVDGRVQTAVIMKYFRRLCEQTKVVVCSGNHDLDARDAAGEKVSQWLQKVRHLGIATDGDAFEVEDTLFSVCAWWDGPRSREAVDAQLARDAARRRGRWVWVYHSPPDASPTSWSGTRHFGDKDLSAWIAAHAPDMVMTGHIHDSPFRPEGSWVDRVGATWVFNAGRQIGPVPTHIVIDTATQSARWFAFGTSEGVRLDGALTRPLPRLTEPPDWLL